MMSRNHGAITSTTASTSTTSMHRGDFGELVKVLPVRRIPGMCHTVMPDDMSSVKFVRGGLVGGRMTIGGGGRSRQRLARRVPLGQ